MAKKQRFIAILMATVILFISLSFAVYSVHNAEHDCIGEGCSICAQIDMCRNLVTSISVAVIAVYIAAVTHRRNRLVLRSTKRMIYASPVSNKVRLLN